MSDKVVVYDSNTDREEPRFTEEALRGAVESMRGETVPITVGFNPLTPPVGEAYDFEFSDGKLWATVDLEVDVSEEYFTIGGVLFEDDYLMITEVGATNDPSWGPENE